MTPTVEMVIAKGEEMRNELPASEFPMAVEDFLTRGWPDADYIETSTLRGVLLSHAKDKPEIVGSWIQPGYAGSKPPSDSSGNPKFPKWAQDALAAGSKVVFLKEKLERRSFSSVNLTSLDQSLGSVELSPEARLTMKEHHPVIGRTRPKVQNAVNEIEGALAKEIKTRTLRAAEAEKAHEKTDARFEQAIAANSKMVNQIESLHTERLVDKALIQQLQHQIIQLGGVPLLVATAASSVGTGRSITRQ